MKQTSVSRVIHKSAKADVLKNANFSINQTNVLHSDLQKFVQMNTKKIMPTNSKTISGNVRQSKSSKQGNKRKITSNLQDQYNVPVCNSMETLINNNNTDDVNTTPVNKHNFLPPINIKDGNHKSVNDIIKQLNINQSQYRTKYTKFGARVQLKSKEDHVKVIDHLKRSSLEYYTYQLPEDRKLKFVLLGLHNIEPSALKTELIKVGLPATDVIPIKINKKRYEDHNVYLVKFPKNSVTLRALQQIRAIFNVIVQWQHYRNKTPGPTMCSRCQNYGHGQANCNIKTRCPWCAGDHNIKLCKLLNVPELLTTYTCCNCGGNHKASSFECPKRKEYFEHAQKIAVTRQKQAFKKSPNFENSNYEKEFPLSWKVPQSTVKPSTSTQPNYAAIASSSRSACTSVFRQEPVTNLSESIYSNMECNDDNLLTPKLNLLQPEEIQPLLLSIISDLAECKTRAQQITALVKITVKYLYGSTK